MLYLHTQVVQRANYLAHPFCVLSQVFASLPERPRHLHEIALGAPAFNILKTHRRFGGHNACTIEPRNQQLDLGQQRPGLSECEYVAGVYSIVVDRRAPLRWTPTAPVVILPSFVPSVGGGIDAAAGERALVRGTHAASMARH